MVSTVGMRTILCTDATKKQQLTKLDVKTAFIQTGKAERDVKVVAQKNLMTRLKFFRYC